MEAVMHDEQMATPVLGRRDAIAGAAGLALAGLPLMAQSQTNSTAETARGTVFDADTSGRGIPGVMVSNGSDVVKTDEAGRWSLPVSPGDSLFVIKPAGWAT